MSDLVTPAVSRRLRRAVEQFRDTVSVSPAGSWRQLSDAQLWAFVLRQIAVVGGARSGEQLQVELAPDLEHWYGALLSTPSRSRSKAIHKRLRDAGVRYVTEDHNACKKSHAAAHNFDLLESFGGPANYFSKIAAIPEDTWRIAVIGDEFRFIRNKGARDLLIWLGLAENAIALDSRVQAALTRMGMSLPPDLAANKTKYKSLERELLEKVCVPCSISGAHLDRILFYRWKEL